MAYLFVVISIIILQAACVNVYTLRRFLSARLTEQDRVGTHNHKNNDEHLYEHNPSRDS
ncbi:hypothetical protein EMIT0194P_170117 [Pseudomonas serbica]